MAVREKVPSPWPGYEFQGHDTNGGLIFGPTDEMQRRGQQAHYDMINEMRLSHGTEGLVGIMIKTGVIDKDNRDVMQGGE